MDKLSKQEKKKLMGLLDSKIVSITLKLESGVSLEMSKRVFDNIDIPNTPKKP